MRFRTILLTLLVSLFMIMTTSRPARSQNATVRGFVYEQESGEPVIFTNVYFAKTSIGATTDENGYFAITKIPAGDYILMVTYVGFDTLQMPLSIKAGDIITKKLYLTKASVTLSEVNVSAAGRTNSAKRKPPSSRSIRSRSTRSRPSGEPPTWPSTCRSFPA